MKIRSFFVLSLLLLLPQPVLADIIVPGQTDVDYCAQISNANQFPEYLFIAYIKGPIPPDKGYQILESGECIEFGYKSNDARLYAIEREKFDESAIDFWKLWDEMSENERQELIRDPMGGGLIEEITENRTAPHSDDAIRYAALQAYFATEDDLIPLNADINRRTYKWFWDPRNTVTESFTVTQDSAGNLQLEKTVETGYFTAATFFYALALIAVIIIIIVLKRR
jgi:hypothetical protein